MIRTLILFACLLLPRLALAQTAAGVAPTLTACRTARGSVAASENLGQLKKLPPATAGVTAAIEECEGKVKELRDKEDATWDRAGKAADSGSCAAARSAFQDLNSNRTFYQLRARDELDKLRACKEREAAITTGAPANCNAKALADAQGAFNSNNFTQAKQFAQTLTGCPPPIGDDSRKLLDRIATTEKNNALSREITVHLTRKEFEPACVKLRQIEASDPKYPRLTENKKTAGGCPAPVVEKPPAPVVEEKVAAPPPAPPPPPPDPHADSYANATRLLREERLDEAETVFRAIFKANAGYKDVRERVAEIDRKKKELKNKSTEQRFTELMAAAKDLFGRGNYQESAIKLGQAKAIFPDRVAKDTLSGDVDAAIRAEEDDLVAALDAYYRGDYAGALGKLNTFLQANHSPRYLSAANFYAGAATASQYYLDGGKDSEKMSAAKRFFAEAVRGVRDFAPDRTAISPKILGLFSEVVAGTK